MEKLITTALIISSVMIFATFMSGVSYSTVGDAKQQEKDVAAQDEQGQQEAGSTTIDVGNNTDVHITCTENIENLVTKCG